MSLPSKKRKLSDEASLPPIDVTSPKQPAPRKDSGASGTSDDTAAMALKALSALDAHSSRNPLKKRKASLDSSMESDQALGLAPPPLGSSSVDNTTNTNAAAKEKNTESETTAKSNNKKGSSTALDHLDALGEGDAASLGSSKQPKAKGVELVIGGDEAASGGESSGLASSNQRVLLDALLSSGGTARRDRLESWGGMSDLSATGIGGGDSARLGDAAAALAASALHYTGLIEDVTAAAHHPRTGSIGSLSSGEGRAAVPSRISLAGGDRKMSVASEFSMFGNSGDGSDPVVPHIQAFVDAAMATVGDQLEDLAGAVEMAASGTDIASVSSDLMRKAEGDSDVSSTVSPLIGTVTDFGARRGRARSLSTSSKPLSVDMDAVAAAVDAAHAATGALDLSTIGGMAPPPVPSVVLSNADSDLDRKPAAVDDLSSKRKSSSSDQDMEAIRARARKAAGYVLSNKKDATPEPRPPLKKRPKQPTPDKTPSAAVGLFPDIVGSTPRVSNMSARPFAPGMPMPPLVLSSNPPVATSASKLSDQKWDDMFDGLVQFVEDQKEEETKGMTQKQKEEWEWDGNVPTSYQTPDGKKLGRWVNNQRTSKTKGTLKPEREAKLVGTGLRWSTLSINSWQEMMNELHLYVAEKTKDGQEWDGNVPATYKIKRDGAKGEEEKNLGRWVNRQRSAKQNGKLQKEREDALTAIGLRWHVLSTASWDDMYNVLCNYVKEQKEADPKGKWDGNVPSNYKTKGPSPKALGRWVNRQRSNHSKKKLKKEYVDRLQALGLKWSVHGDRNNRKVSTGAPPTHVIVNDSNKEVATVTETVLKAAPKTTPRPVRRGRSLPLNRRKGRSESIDTAAVKMKAAI